MLTHRVQVHEINKQEAHTQEMLLCIPDKELDTIDAVTNMIKGPVL